MAAEKAKTRRLLEERKKAEAAERAAASKQAAAAVKEKARLEQVRKAYQPKWQDAEAKLRADIDRKRAEDLKRQVAIGRDPAGVHTFLCGTPPNQYRCPSTTSGTAPASNPTEKTPTARNPFIDPTPADHAASQQKMKKASEEEWRQLTGKATLAKETCAEPGWIFGKCTVPKDGALPTIGVPEKDGKWCSFPGKQAVCKPVNYQPPK